MEKNTYKIDFLKDKNILVTGASKGIGKSLAINLSSYGANTILLARNEESLDSLYDEIKEKFNTSPMIIKCDLSLLEESSAQKIANLITQNYEVLDALINNASVISKMSSITDYDLKNWEEVFNINLKSSFLLSKYLVPLLKHSKLPRLIFTSSRVAIKGKAFWGAYSASKAGVKALSEILNEELDFIPNFKVFNFDPKATRTDMRALAYPAEDPSTLKDPEKLIEYYLWMLSEQSSCSSKVYIEFDEQM